MSFQHQPETSKHGSMAEGKLIAVGIPWESGLFIQEYWQDGQPSYALANTADESIEVSIVDRFGGPQARLAGPWTLAPHSVECVPIDGLLTQSSGTLVGVATQHQPLLGLLRPPEPLALPPDRLRWPEVLTVDGLNGLGDRYTNIHCWQPQLRFGSGDVISLLVGIPANTGTLQLAQHGSATGLPSVEVRDATSETLSVERQGEAVIVGAQETPGVDWHEVALTVLLPDVTAPTLAAWMMRLVGRGGSSSYVARGFVVEPAALGP